MRRVLPGALVLVALAVLSTPSHAHFTLEEPASWRTQNALGLPEKLGPCGNEDGGTDTGIVTAFQTGQTITVTIDEKIFHPGHYRIALAVHDRSELPPEPVVTPGATPCGSVPIEDPPVFPVLADGVFQHTTPFTGPQSIQIALPPGVTCDKCTLQVIEFMSSHPLNNPGGCFYHHCADISISDVPVEAGTDAGTNVPDAGNTATPSGAGDNGGCSCAVPAGSSSGAGAWALLALAALAWRRRR